MLKTQKTTHKLDDVTLSIILPSTRAQSHKVEEGLRRFLPSSSKISFPASPSNAGWWWRYSAVCHYHHDAHSHKQHPNFTLTMLQLHAKQHTNPHQTKLHQQTESKTQPRTQTESTHSNPKKFFTHPY